MHVSDRVQVVRLQRQAPHDRSAFLERRGRLVQRLSVPWESDTGSLWRIRFEDGSQEVFSAAELALLDEEGTVLDDSPVSELRHTWGQAPRTPSSPFRRRLGAGSRGAKAALAALVLSVAGILLVWAAIASGNAMLGAGGAGLLLVAIATAAVMVS